MHKIIFFILFLGTTFSAFSQDNPIVKYYDSNWVHTDKENAFYYSEYVKTGEKYLGVFYWMEGKKRYSKSIYADTSFYSPEGFRVSYQETGEIKDSTSFHPKNDIKEKFIFYPSGKLWGHYTFDIETKTEKSKGYDEKGKEIKDFIVQKDAMYRGGNGPWTAYISKTINSDVPIKNKAPLGTYSIIIRFAIDIDGSVTELLAETNFGYGMEQEALRVISNSPKWIPAQELGKFVKAYRRQPITFAVIEDKKQRKN
jgi:hypothetical protein